MTCTRGMQTSKSTGIPSGVGENMHGLNVYLVQIVCTMCATVFGILENEVHMRG